MVYEALVAEGAAERAGQGRYTILDKAKAHSGRIMPKVLNPLGKKGWALTAVNKMECFIFAKGAPVEYRVVTPPEMDRLGLLQLEAEGHAAFSGVSEDRPEIEITSPGAALPSARWWRRPRCCRGPRTGAAVRRAAPRAA